MGIQRMLQNDADQRENIHMNSWCAPELMKSNMACRFSQTVMVRHSVGLAIALT
ncbi:MAG: hypothetical protein NVS3B14_03290 [Ktedonobacteraceae bacterium]